MQIAFSSRIRCYARWQTAESEARRTKQAHERARNQGTLPQDRVPHSLAQIAEVGSLPYRVLGWLSHEKYYTG